MLVSPYEAVTLIFTPSTLLARVVFRFLTVQNLMQPLQPKHQPRPVKVSARHGGTKIDGRC
jgi:hypothetical protein